MSESGKIGDIQVLRAIAILLVVTHHVNGSLFSVTDPVWAIGWIRDFYQYFGGEVGVDLFFVISGFVIARGLLPEIQRSRLDGGSGRVLAIFWLKRAFRLLPAAWLWLLFIVCCSVFFNSSGSFGSFRSAFEGAVAAVLHVANVRFMECYGYSECGATVVYWSLSLEEQFYFVLPLLALLLGRNIGIGLLLILLSQFVELFSVPGVFRLSGLAVGVLIAIFSHGETWRLMDPVPISRHRMLFGALFFFLLLVLSSVLGPGLHVAHGSLKYDMAALLSGVFVLIASYDRNYFVAPGLVRSSLEWLGTRSYSIYLSHIPAFYLVREIFYRSDYVFTSPLLMLLCYLLIAVGMILLMSEASYRFVEVYWQRRGHGVIQRFSMSAYTGARA